MPKVDFPEDVPGWKNTVDEAIVKDPVFGVPPYKRSFRDTAKIMEENAKAVAEYEVEQYEKRRLFDAFSNLFPVWAYLVKRYHIINPDTLRITFVKFSEDGLDEYDETRFFSYQDPNNWTFTTNFKEDDQNDTTCAHNNT